MIKTSKRRGFTLVELSLAIVLVSILTLAIMTVAMQIMKIYSKGVTLKTSNQVARDISDRLTRDVHAASIGKINLTQVSKGRLCIGDTSYLWNTAAILNNGSSQKITVPLSTGTTAARLVRINDPSQQFCAIPLKYDVTSAMQLQPVELLGQTGNGISTGNNLAIYDLSVVQFVSDQPIFEVAYTIGTNAQGAVSNLTASAQCKPPTDSSANFDFCTVSEFDLIVKASTAGGS